MGEYTYFNNNRCIHLKTKLTSFENDVSLLLKFNLKVFLYCAHKYGISDDVVGFYVFIII